MVENTSEKIQQKPVLIPRMISETDMLNMLNDKLDWIIAKLMEEEKK